MLTLTYYGAEKVVANYNVMGVAKAALEASVRYLAADLGPDGIRVNAISAGPIRTISAAGISGFKKMYGSFADIAPLRTNITPDEIDLYRKVHIRPWADFRRMDVVTVLTGKTQQVPATAGSTGP